MSPKAPKTKRGFPGSRQLRERKIPGPSAGKAKLVLLDDRRWSEALYRGAVADDFGIDVGPRAALPPIIGPSRGEVLAWIRGQTGHTEQGARKLLTDLRKAGIVKEFGGLPKYLYAPERLLLQALDPAHRVEQTKAKLRAAGKKGGRPTKRLI